MKCIASGALGNLEYRSKVAVTLVVEQLKLIDGSAGDDIVDRSSDSGQLHAPLENASQRRPLMARRQLRHIDASHRKALNYLCDPLDLRKLWVHRDD